MQQEEYNNMEHNGRHYSEGYDDGFELGVIEGRRQMLQEVKELLEKLKNDSKRVFKTG